MGKKQPHTAVDLDLDQDLGQSQDLDQNATLVLASEVAQDQNPVQQVTPSTTSHQIPVGGATLTGRIKRVLRTKQQDLKQYRGTKNSSNELAGWYIVDLGQQACIGHYKDLEALGRELGVLQPWERLASQ